MDQLETADAHTEPLPPHRQLGEGVSVSVVVPTYREAENIPALVERLAAVRAGAGLCLELILVDDDSRDGTAELVAELAREHPWVHLVVRTDPRSLSGAVLHGVRVASGERLVVMDADLSHPPEALPTMLASLDAGADVVLGSRYAEGGSVAADWGLDCRLRSRVATWLARPLVRVQDPLSGFIALRRSAMNEVPSLAPIGFKFGLELSVKGPALRVVEVPIHFARRAHGRSKLSLRQEALFLVHLARLYWFSLVSSTRRREAEGGSQ